MAKLQITIKRAYDKASLEDGYRVLVDRLWPRGVKKEVLAIDEWRKDITPSTELRKWFGHQSEKFEEFRVRYEEELKGSYAPQQLLKKVGEYKKLTLVYSAKDPKINHAVILKNYLERLDV